jgi:hypothetical protein
MALRTESKVVLHSSDRELEKGFERLKHQALQWVYEGYPVGDYYEAALPNRDAFCMRDVSHQCTGGEVLGLSRHNKNMFLKFAKSISDVRDWCAHWEIDRWDRPCPVDHTNDQDFWYNLPGNFDVLDACWRMYLWTGDRDYLAHDDFDYFYAQTMEAYIKRWDSNSDGLPDRKAPKKEGRLTRRGVPGYDEAASIWNTLQTATDMVAVMGRAHLSYARICGQLGRSEQEAIYLSRGKALLERLNSDFYRDDLGFAKGFDFEGKLLYPDKVYTSGRHMLYWDAVPDQSRQNKMLDAYASDMEKVQIEDFSHFPEILWRYGRNEDAMHSLWRLMDPELARKEYPEASYCGIGAVATGLMGICPDSTTNTIATLSGLVGTDWVELSYVPVLGGEISIRHDGLESSQLSWRGDKCIVWKPSFCGVGSVNGITLQPGETVVVSRE